MKRREFLKKTGTIALGAGLSTLSHKVLGANERINLGVIGTGRIAWENMNVFLENNDVQIGAVCDVYQPHLQKGIELTGGKAKGYGDFRRILEDKDIDAVMVSSPDHWHALQTIMACEAGKDVYVEKPISHNIYEGRVMVEAARKYNRIVQVGTQQRSGIHYQEAVKFIQSGKLGEIGLVRCFNFSNEYPGGIGNPQETEPPSDLDWDMWLGPAPKVPYNRNRWHFPGGWATFRYFWDYAGGMLTDWGVHHIDIIQWAMKADSPVAVNVQGGKYYMKDNRDTPDTLEAVFEYPMFICIYSNTVLNKFGIDNAGYRIQFYGTKGTMLVTRSGWEVIPEEKSSKDKKKIKLMEPVEMKAENQRKPHIRNFIDCIKSRNLPICDIETGHYSTVTPLLGKISYLVNERIKWDAKNEIITNSKKGNQLLSREYRSPWKLPDYH
ncbi:Gfo/Idh/MocA family protein [candidate division KSB1 bacterium]